MSAYDVGALGIPECLRLLPMDPWASVRFPPAVARNPGVPAGCPLNILGVPTGGPLKAREVPAGGPLQVGGKRRVLALPFLPPPSDATGIEAVTEGREGCSRLV